MQAIIMAAGRGTRISKDIGGVPKCTLRLGDVPLIRHTVLWMLAHGINVTVVVGYEGDAVRRELDDLPIEFVVNPFYDVTNSIASLWFARESLTKGGDVVLMNGDVFADESILEMTLAEQRTPVMLVDTRRTLEGDFFFGFGEDNILRRFGKNLPPAERAGEYVGVAKIDKAHVPGFARKLDELIHEQRHDAWWEDVLYSTTAAGGVVYVRDVGNCFWSEVDHIGDYRALRYRFGEYATS
ncbi:NTP transferase domain-containing protein [Aquisalimonas asiatica]|uniref:Choline kinase n=1 Tax=Aquisalimonas asiatica TaxID=406100 RepID=A0A1H8QV60_9GAMM|nr:phosphocholine cytidylyltransferase family protein [Aquisalimonas asiatica]SEO58075.1 Choline kinase [Aquisalimonas asiatica]